MYKVIQEFRGAHDGFTVVTYKVDDVFPHTGSLLKVALENKWIKEVADEVKQEEESETVEIAETDEVETSSEETEVESLPEEPAIKTKRHR